MPDPRTITADQAEDILEAADCDPGEQASGFTYVTTVKGGSRRWMQGVRIVVTDPDGAFWGLDYDRGLTEDQPNEYPWRGSGSVALIPLYPHTITETVYRTKPQEVTA